MPERPVSRMPRAVTVAVVLALVIGIGAGTVAGCATGSPRSTASVAIVDQERTILDLRARNAGQARQIEELENRIFILEDQLDSRRLAAEQKAPAILPATKLRARSPSTKSRRAVEVGAPEPSGLATQQEAGPDKLEATAEPSVESTIVAEDAVEYTGDATFGAPGGDRHNLAGPVRPLLRLSSTSARERSALSAGEGTAPVAPEPGVAARPQVSAPARPDPLHIYRQALETLRAGHPGVALPQFRRFLDENPVHDYADNAQYWIGECHYAEGRFRAAERAFRDVVERYPRGNKVPDAMLKLGFTLQTLGDEAGGRTVLESLARAFPKQEAARLASERLAHPEPAPARASSGPVFGTTLPAPPPPVAAGAASAVGQSGR